MALWLICSRNSQAVANPHSSKCWLWVSAMCLSRSCCEQVKEKEQSPQFQAASLVSFAESGILIKKQTVIL